MACKRVVMRLELARHGVARPRPRREAPRGNGQCRGRLYVSWPVSQDTVPLEILPELPVQNRVHRRELCVEPAFRKPPQPKNASCRRSLVCPTLRKCASRACWNTTPHPTARSAAAARACAAPRHRALLLPALRPPSPPAANSPNTPE